MDLVNHGLDVKGGSERMDVGGFEDQPRAMMYAGGAAHADGGQ